jgi:hypothetical protein
MSSRSRLLLVAGFVSAVAAGTVLSPTSVCATSGGCFFPTIAVGQYLSTTGNDIENNLSENPGRCKEQCDEEFNGCNGVADAAEECVLEAAGADAGAEVRGCNDFSPPSSGECKRSSREDLRNFTDLVKDDKSSARSDCADAKASCNAQCGQVPE